MKHVQYSKSLSSFSLAVILAGALAFSHVLTVHAQAPPARAAWELATRGITPTEFTRRQDRLLTQLRAEMPPGTTRNPIYVSLTDEDVATLATPINSGGPAPLRVGIVKTLSPGIDILNGRGFDQGTIQYTHDGGFVWAKAVTSPGAQAIRVHLTNFSLPANFEMYFYSPDGQAHGPYTGDGRGGKGDFWTRSIKSPTGILQLKYVGEALARDMRKISFSVADVGHIRGRPPLPDQRSHDSWPCSDNAPCVVDASCVGGTPADVAKDGVAKIEWIQGIFIYTCSGGLLADTDPNTQIPYFLTANHCLSSSNSSLETFFFYSTDSCNGVCPDSLVTGGTPPAPSTIGATVKATGSASDYTLLTLNEDPPAGSTFLGWNNSPIAFSNGAQLYRISNPNFGPQAYSQHEVDTSRPTCTSWPRGARIYSSDIVGATMGGSSGSPVLNSAGEVVGQLSGCCGFNCGNECDATLNATVDGALASYWDDVAPFLDPQVSCNTDADCADLDLCNGDEVCISGDCQPGTPVVCNDNDACTSDTCIASTGACSHSSISCDDGQLCTIDSCNVTTGCANDPVQCPVGQTCNSSNGQCELPICNNDGSCGAGEDCNNCPNDCRHKTNGNPNSRYCCNGDLTDCGDARCSEVGWSCGSSAACTSDSECVDGLFCNGTEACVGGSCQNGIDPCPGQGCNETTDQCTACGGNKAQCTFNGDCCSNHCKNGSCRGN